MAVRVELAPSARDDLLRFVASDEDKRQILRWASSTLSHFPQIGTMLLPPEATSRQWVIDGRWRIIWDVQFDDHGEAVTASILRIVPAKSEWHLR